MMKKCDLIPLGITLYNIALYYVVRSHSCRTFSLISRNWIIARGQNLVYTHYQMFYKLIDRSICILITEHVFIWRILSDLNLKQLRLCRIIMYTDSSLKPFKGDNVFRINSVHLNNANINNFTISPLYAECRNWFFVYELNGSS